MNTITQKEFIAAYVWMYGGTKKAAQDIYKRADPKYIQEIVSAYKKNCFLAFYND